MPSLSIVIPTLGRSAALPRVLAALEDQTRAGTEAEVLLVYDAAAEDPGRPEAHRSVAVLQASVPGASAARNAGWRAARAPLVLFLDDDIVPAPGLLEQHAAWHRDRPQREFGVLGLVRWSPRVRVTPFMRWLDTGLQFDYDGIESVEVPWTHFYSCNTSVKREMLERSGGFDQERFPYGYEDLDLGIRLSRLGFQLLFNRRALGWHEKVETLDTWRRNLRRIAVAERRFIDLYPEFRPYFYERFRSAAAAEPARGRSGSLARFVRPRLPWLGPFVWRSYDLVCSQSLAPEFLAAWEAAGGAAA